MPMAGPAATGPNGPSHIGPSAAANAGAHPHPSVPTAAVTSPPGTAGIGPGPNVAKAKPKQPQRTTKTAQKLTLFPEDAPTTQPSQIPEDMLLPEAEDLFDQLTHVPPERIGKLDRKKLPRVTAYCVANAYRLDELIDLLKQSPHLAPPRKFDECAYVCLYSSVGQSVPQPTNTSGFGPVAPGMMQSHQHVHHAAAPARNPLHVTQLPNVPDGMVAPPAAVNGSSTPPGQRPDPTNMDAQETYRVHTEAMGIFQQNMGEVFIYDYGVVVFWGFTEDEERDLLRRFSPFEEESLDPELVQLEEFVSFYHGNYQPRIYNDIISLKNPANYMAKLTISHAIAQSTKLTLFEGLMEETISATKHIPQTMAMTGKVPMSRTAITKKIGQLFIMRINVNLISNVLDVPEVFWSEPALEPLYQAIRSYLEITQRVELLNQRVSVISDLLDMLKEHLTSTHGEQLEWIVIILIGMEIVIGIITILFDYLQFSRGGA
ncbi:hypothetical protein BCR44DRAFT_27973 [Catenaria anguillulae PL171]|uniref:DUF155 domain-containing protein n=1 Tax=Catenaria anguillulae PL171 TaxID=765915 RepID=A0A1Y2HR36_9FUNG|nr:hypothetical protein BCR44DRAFT_27973 [Catenaria anguillulae PL171]